MSPEGSGAFPPRTSPVKRAAKRLARWFNGRLTRLHKDTIAMPDVSFALVTGTLVALAVASFLLAPRARTVEGFFFGTSPAGSAPGIWTLTFSQVTTWSFARSLLNAGILGYFVGIVFGTTGSLAYTVSILAVAGVTLGYSMLGGLHASLRTDVLQFGVLTALLAVLFVMMLLAPEFAPGAILSSSPDPISPGWILLVVALIQVPSYPLHDPVMMDRGFLADRATTRASFRHAFWISALLILAFGLLGIFAGLHRAGEEELLDTLTHLLGQPAALLLGIALVISAASTMDSTFASTAKLAVIDMRLGRHSSADGRIVMALFAAAGLLMVFFGTGDLFAAVAVSGTAALFLTPVIIWSIALDHAVAPAALGVAVAAALLAAALYFFESSGHVGWIEALTGISHNYSKLLLLNGMALAVGLTAFAIGDHGAVHRPA